MTKVKNVIASQELKFMNESGTDISDFNQDEFIQYLAEKAEELDNKLSKESSENEKCDHCLSHKLPDIRFVEREKHITPDTVSLSLLLQQKEKCDLCGEEFWVDVPKEDI